VDDEEDKEDVVKSRSPVEDERRRVLVEEEDDEHDHRLATVHTPGNIMMRFGWCIRSLPIFASCRVCTGTRAPYLSTELYFTGNRRPNSSLPSPAFHGCREDWSKGRNGVGA
jgi:hypothetical protein